MNPLREYPEVRRWAYRAVWGIGLVLGAIQVFCAATSTDAPEWLIGALAVLAYVSVATNYTASQNTPEPMALRQRHDEPDEPTYQEGDDI